MPLIPEHLQGSVGMQFVQSQGWNWNEGTDGNIMVETCPLCKKGDYKFYMKVTGNKDGCWLCYHGSCQKTGNLRTLQDELGITIRGVDSRSAWARNDKKIDPLPNPDECHNRLLGDADALDYLINTRGFTQEIIDKQKLGLIDKMYFREAGEVRALVYPYLVNGNIVYAKYRTLPPSPKDFTCPTGHDAPLYNGEYLQDGIEEVVFVEGEANTIFMLSRSINNVVGVPGANFKKASWIETLDRIAPKRIFIMYDSHDKAGDKASQNLASRIGYDKCLKLVLPEFTVTVPVDECKLCNENGLKEVHKEIRAGIDNKIIEEYDEEVPCEHKRFGKDINEWFMKGGGTVEAFNELKLHAQLFDITGVMSSGNALDELEADLAGRTTLAPTYQPPWKSLADKVGWEDGDVIDIIAPEKIGKTTFGLNIMEAMVDKYNEDGLIICLEMSQARLARKWVCMLTGTDDSPPKSVAEAEERLKRMRAAIPIARAKAAARKGDLHFAYPQIKEPDDVFKLIKDCIRRYGVKWIMFDNLQLLVDSTIGKNYAHRTIILSQTSKMFAKIAKDFGIKMIRIVQPKFITVGNIVTTDNVDGSSQIMKDCDCAITLHRQRLGEIKKNDWDVAGIIETEASFAPKMLVTVGLSRYSCGGSCTLEFLGASSQVVEYNPARQAAMKAQAPSTNGYALPTETLALPSTAGPEQAITTDLPGEDGEMEI